MPTPEGILLFLLFQLVLYGLPLTLLIIGFKTRDRNTRHLLFVLALAPFAYYAYCFVTERILAPMLRDAEVASWPRKPVTNDTLPKTLVTTAGWWVAKTLVAAGPFEKAYALRDENWLIYARNPNPDCPSQREWEKYASESTMLTPTPCVALAGTAAAAFERRPLAPRGARPPELGETHLLLLSDEHARLRHRPNEGVVSGTTLELRWSPDAGGDLIAFWEIPYFNAVVFPPIWLGFKGWARDMHHAPRRYEQRPDPRTFGVEAIKPR